MKPLLLPPVSALDCSERDRGSQLATPKELVVEGLAQGNSYDKIEANIKGNRGPKIYFLLAGIHYNYTLTVIDEVSFIHV